MGLVAVATSQLPKPEETQRINQLSTMTAPEVAKALPEVVALLDHPSVVRHKYCYD
jgi:hypothetical protein